MNGIVLHCSLLFSITAVYASDSTNGNIIDIIGLDKTEVLQVLVENAKVQQNTGTIMAHDDHSNGENAAQNAIRKLRVKKKYVDNF